MAINPRAHRVTCAPTGDGQSYQFVFLDDERGLESVEVSCEDFAEWLDELRQQAP